MSLNADIDGFLCARAGIKSSVPGISTVQARPSMQGRKWPWVKLGRSGEGCPMNTHRETNSIVEGDEEVLFA